MLCHIKYRSRYLAAFSIIELMVVITIMTLVTTVMVSSQSSFNSAVLLRNQAYEVAFAIKEAQLLALSGGDRTVRQYGIHFDTSSSTESTYRLFQDLDDDGWYDTGEQIGLTGKLDSRFEIRAVTPSNGGTLLDISFKRPNFDALFCTRLAGCTTSGNYTSGPAYIDVSRKGQTGNGSGVVRRVQVTATGQVSVVTY